MLSIHPDDGPYQNTLDPLHFLSQLDPIRSGLQKTLDKDHQSELGQFFTPPAISNLMAAMFTRFSPLIHLVDPGAGVGSLSAAFVARAVQASPRPAAIKITAFELDPTLIAGLEATFVACRQLCEQYQIDFQSEIRQEDFIAASVAVLAGKNSLFSVAQPDYNYAILNPPYKKINSNSPTRRLLNSLGLETTNLYSAFMWLVLKLLAPEGEMVAIVPRSFCNGTYFRPFRVDLLRTLAIQRIHLFGARDQAFKEGDVLQENIILRATKTEQRPSKITITSSDRPDDENFVTREIESSQLVQPGDPDQFIRIIADQLAACRRKKNFTNIVRHTGLNWTVIEAKPV